MTDQPEFEPIPNPYAKTEAEAKAIAEELNAVSLIGSTLSIPAERAQISALFGWVRIIGRGDRDCTNAVVWEMCNQVRYLSGRGVKFKPMPAHEKCPCPVDHVAAAEHYNRFIADSIGMRFQDVIDRLNAIVGDIYDDLGVWLCAMADDVADVRFPGLRDD